MNQGQPRKPIVLMGGPSGAGKTVISQTIIRGELPFFAAACGCDLSEAVRYDSIRLTSAPPRDEVLLIECATHKPSQLEATRQWQVLQEVVGEAERVVFVTIEISKLKLFRQYFWRIFAEPRHRSPLWRAVQVSKYRNALLYLTSRQFARSKAFWARFGQALAAGPLADRLVTVRLHWTGAEYRISVDGVGSGIPEAERAAILRLAG